MLAKAITLVESSLASDRKLASDLIDSILPYTGNSIRIGISGVPGVGKSTFIEMFGNLLVSAKRRVAVLSVDPSSPLTHGSILGDKTRMENLSRNPNAFIRPSAARDALGGVAVKTREAMLLCEAAGFNIIIVETVGVGQSETSVRGMVDFFLLLMLAGAGDELQGIKKGIMEMADTIAITKADGDNISRATAARRDFQQALHLYESPKHWTPRVVTCSALENKGIEEIWSLVEEYHLHTTANGYLQRLRSNQNVRWFQELFDSIIKYEISQRPDLLATQQDLVSKVSTGELSPSTASTQLFAAVRASL